MTIANLLEDKKTECPINRTLVPYAHGPDFYHMDIISYWE